MDGYDDFILGAFADDDGAANAGATYLVLGESGTIASSKLMRSLRLSSRVKTRAIRLDIVSQVLVM